MIQDPIPTLKPTLEEVRDQFESWRKSRERRTAIPEALFSLGKPRPPPNSGIYDGRGRRLRHSSLWLRRLKE